MFRIAWKKMSLLPWSSYSFSIEGLQANGFSNRWGGSLMLVRKKMLVFAVVVCLISCRICCTVKSFKEWNV